MLWCKTDTSLAIIVLFSPLELFNWQQQQQPGVLLVDETWNIMLTIYYFMRIIRDMVNCLRVSRRFRPISVWLTPYTNCQFTSEMRDWTKLLNATIATSCVFIFEQISPPNHQNLLWVLCNLRCHSASIWRRTQLMESVQPGPGGCTGGRRHIPAGGTLSVLLHSHKCPLCGSSMSSTVLCTSPAPSGVC